MIAMIEENFRTGTAGTGIAHGPEIIRCRDSDNPVIRQACDFFPQVKRLIIFMIHRNQKPVFRQTVFLCHKVPGELNRTILEVIAEREIAEHLEEGVMSRRIADILQIVMLSPGAHTFLRRHRPVIIAMLCPGENVLELNHPGIGEHQRRIITRYQRTGRDNLVTVLREVVEECITNIVGALHRRKPSV